MTSRVELFVTKRSLICVCVESVVVGDGVAMLGALG